MGRVKIKHPRSREADTKRTLLHIIGPTVKVTRLIAARDAIIALTSSDKDSDGLFTDEVSEQLRAAGFEAVMPPELRSQRAVICFRLDDFVLDYSPAQLKAEIERCQSWATVSDVYRFTRSNTMKITFATSEMAAKACDQGLLMFLFSVPPAQMRREIYVPLLTCDRCHAVESHQTTECPHPPTFRLCSECSQQGHTFRDCTTGAQKCLNCNGEHNARAMRCPVRKVALKEKEERMRKAADTPSTSFAQTAAAPRSAPLPTLDAATQMKGFMCLMHAQVAEASVPGSFQRTLSANLQQNGLPDVRLTPLPTTQGLLQVLAAASAGAPQPQPGHPPPQDHRAPTPTQVQPRPSTPPPAEHAPTPTPPIAVAAAPTSPVVAAAPSAVASPTSEDTETEAAYDEAPTSDDEEDEPEFEVYLIKDAADKWPRQLTFNAVKRGLTERRYKVAHNAQDVDLDTLLVWLRDRKDSIADYCYSVPTSVFRVIQQGNGASDFLGHIRPDFSNPGTPQ